MHLAQGKKDLLLIFPPFWDAGHAYLSVPTLVGYLRSKGFSVDARDLNRDCIYSMIQSNAIEISLSHAHHTLSKMGKKKDPTGYEKFRSNLDECETVWRIGGESLLEPFYHDAPPPVTIDDHTAMRRKLEWIFRIHSAPCYPLSLTGTGLVYEDMSRLSTIVAVIRCNGFVPGAAFLDQFADRTFFDQIPVVGISVAGPSQLLPALYLARIVKKKSPSTIVCVGGPQIPYVVPALEACPDPFEWVDTFVVGEGELPLSDLLSAVRAGKDFDTIAGLYIYRERIVKHIHGTRTLDITTLPPPDFEGFEPTSYIANDGTIALTFARGCSWGRCAFCSQHACFDGYRAMDKDQAALHIKTLLEHYPIKTIHFNDENITPKRLIELGSIIQKHSPDIMWQALARFSPTLEDPEVARKLVEKGCRMLCLGLESGDQSVLNYNRKGIRTQVANRVMRNLHDAGIWVHIFLIFGLPGETRESAMNTLVMMDQNQGSFDSISPTIFRLERLSPIAENPSQYGIITGTIPDDHCDAALPAESDLWMGKAEAMVFLEFLIQQLLGSAACPVEQSDLKGQILIDLLAQYGVHGLRQIMVERGRQTQDAKGALEFEEILFQRCWEKLCQFGDNGTSAKSLIMALPERGLYVPLHDNQRTWLQLRSLGLPLETIMEKWGSIGGDSEERIEFDWNIEVFLLSILGSRIFQETLVSLEQEAPRDKEHSQTGPDRLVR